MTEAQIAWGAKVSRAFRDRVQDIAHQLIIDPSWLMACMAFESGRSFRADVRNAAGSGAVGLIQFMPSTAQALGTNTDALARLSPESQLAYVYMYFQPRAGRLKSLGDLYMAILWPAAIGKPEDYVLFDRADANHPKRYVQNAGLDFNKDGQVTKEEAAWRVRRELAIGLRPENLNPINGA